MIQGTTSDAGKSAIVTALCRLYRDLGMSVAPFKSQNMALNSAVTLDQGEIGRAQAVQAFAAGIEPTTDMNPVLLKPNSDLGAQVIVHGRAIGNMDARTYHGHKPALLEDVVDAHNRLAAEFDAVFIEGAGSAGEVNLREHDIANMGLAEAIDCPVVIVADIDRGGVFAHLLGTLDVLSASEQARVVGFIINRFRGDIRLLEPGLEWLEQRTGRPVLAVLPYLDNLHIEAEDGLSRGGNSGDEKRALQVVVPLLPKISNYTDLDPLRRHPDVAVTYCDHPDQIGKADLIILPGSKNVRSDLAWLKQRGFDRLIERHLRYRGKVLGICGGYQMLGQWIHDPEGVEDSTGSSEGLGWFAMDTVLTGDKTLTRVKGTLSLGGAVEGYEIHVGRSTHSAAHTSLVSLADHKEDGVISDDGQLAGSYLHGLFDHPEALASLLRWAGLEAPAKFDYQTERDEHITRLSQALDRAWPEAKHYITPRT
ncbi:cobyric acid synthase [Larsenimonas salina]|uniref:cobyric acid synthase n=1 Tax=Larsenimonas salina TaxID=1295565 RepID=UPI0020731E41|nr:cobyric acid synthase [Larsenimonas salina]MCM5703660.1 cobyric acid synthase [Larsenimonas salina]